MWLPNIELPRVLVPAIADRIGVSRARVRTEVRRGNWRIIARGIVLTRPDEPTRADWAAAGIALAGPTAALSGWDALRVRGLGSAMPPDPEVLVLSRHASNRVIGQVRIRETARHYAVEVTPWDAAGYPLTPVVPAARAIADASAYCSARSDVRSLVTSAVQRRRCTLAQLTAELRCVPRQGSAAFRSALSDAVDGARSEAEARAARRLAREPLPPFELNVPLVAPDGTLIAIADAFWRELRAVLEIDSREYHLDEASWKRTMARHNRLTRFGLALTHYPPSIVMARRRDWLIDVGAWLRDRAAELGVTWRTRGGIRRPPESGPAPFVLTRRPTSV